LHYRTDKEVRTKWQNMQTSAKKQYADRKNYATQTGGGPPAKELSNEAEKIVDMMKDCSLSHPGPYYICYISVSLKKRKEMKEIKALNFN
jgi:hypothetical protein